MRKDDHDTVETKNINEEKEDEEWRYIRFIAHKVDKPQHFYM